MSQAHWHSITSCCTGAPQALFYFYGKWKAAQCPMNLCHVHRSTRVIKMTGLFLGKKIKRSHTLLRTFGHYCVGEGAQLKFNKPHLPSQSSALILGGEASAPDKSAIRANVTCPSYKNCCVLERFCCHLQQQQDQSYQMWTSWKDGNHKVTFPNWNCTKHFAVIILWKWIKILLKVNNLFLLHQQSPEMLWWLKANQTAIIRRKYEEFSYQTSLGERVRDFNMNLSLLALNSRFNQTENKTRAPYYFYRAFS